jgi:hypothetical protein
MIIKQSSLTLTKGQHQQISDLLKTEKGLYLPYVAKMLGVDADELMYEIVDHYPGRVQGNLWVLDDDKRSWVYEVCNTKYDRS